MDLLRCKFPGEHGGTQHHSVSDNSRRNHCHSHHDGIKDERSGARDSARQLIREQHQRRPADTSSQCCSQPAGNEWCAWSRRSGNCCSLFVRLRPERVEDMRMAAVVHELALAGSAGDMWTDGIDHNSNLDSFSERLRPMSMCDVPPPSARVAFASDRQHTHIYRYTCTHYSTHSTFRLPHARVRSLHTAFLALGGFDPFVVFLPHSLFPTGRNLCPAPKVRGRGRYLDLGAGSASELGIEPGIELGSAWRGRRNLVCASARDSPYKVQACFHGRRVLS